MPLAYYLAAADLPEETPLSAAHASGHQAKIESQGPASRRAQRDALWTERIRTGDRAAFAALYREYLAAMIGFAYRIVQSMPIAEDLCADVFVTLWERRTTWTPQHGARAYLFHAVRMRALNVIRDTALHRRMLGYATPENTPSISVPVDERLDDERKLAAVRAAFAQLPELRRRVMQLRCKCLRETY